MTTEFESEIDRLEEQVMLQNESTRTQLTEQQNMYEQKLEDQEFIFNQELAEQKVMYDQQLAEQKAMYETQQNIINSKQQDNQTLATKIKGHISYIVDALSNI